MAAASLKLAEAHGGGARACIVWDVQGKALATAGGDARLLVHNVASPDEPPLAASVLHQKAVTALCMAPNGHTLASASLDKTVKLYSYPGMEFCTILFICFFSSTEPSFTLSPERVVVVVKVIDLLTANCRALEFIVAPGNIQHYSAWSKILQRSLTVPRISWKSQHYLEIHPSHGNFPKPPSLSLVTPQHELEFLPFLF